MSDLLRFEDYAAGQVIDLGSYAVTAAEIRELLEKQVELVIDGGRSIG